MSVVVSGILLPSVRFSWEQNARALLCLHRARRNVLLRLEALTGAQMALLNTRCKPGATGATDVLSFPSELTSLLDGDGRQRRSHSAVEAVVLSDMRSCLALAAEGSTVDLGTMFVCPEYIRGMVSRFPAECYPIDAYFAAAFVHGLMHLHGHRHDTDAAHAGMLAAERRCHSFLRREWRRGRVPPLSMG